MLPDPSVGWVLMLVAMAITSAIALHIGRRARRIVLPETCHRCGYDVSHRPDGNHTCSECGADLAGEGAIIKARSRPNWRLVVPSAMTLTYAVVILLLMASD